jgi:excisionase family DNA binding protein
MPDPTPTPTTPEAAPAGDPPRLALRPREAARALGIGERKLWELTNRRAIPHIKLGKVVLYPVGELERWLAEQTKGARR